jgi:hypothetical protein
MENYNHNFKNPAYGMDYYLVILWEITELYYAELIFTSCCRKITKEKGLLAKHENRHLV